MACLAHSQVWAQQNTSVVSAVEQLLALQTAKLPGRVSIEIGNFADNERYRHCSNWAAALPEGMRPWGKVSINVRCTSGTTASLYVSARIKVEGTYVVSARAISAGQLITADDLRMAEGELTAQAPDILVTPQQAIGHTARSFIAAERPLRLALLRNEMTIQSGQEVKILVRGNGFTVASTGRALDSAVRGDLIRVRLQNGQIITATVIDKGLVENKY